VSVGAVEVNAKGPVNVPPINGKYAVELKAFDPNVNKVVGAFEPNVTSTAPVRELYVILVT